MKKSVPSPIMETLKGIPFTHIADLSHTLNAAIPIFPWPGTFQLEMKPIFTIEKDGSAVDSWYMMDHYGTHIDAPSHMEADGKTVDQMSLKNLVVPGVVFDITKKAAQDPNAMLTTEDILQWEEKHGKVPENAAVLLYSGWDKYLHDEKFMGIDEKGIAHFPGYSPEAVQLLVEKRNVAGLGTECVSTASPIADKGIGTHHLILGNDKWIIETLTNLGSVPPAGATIFILPLKVEGASGSPVRVVACW